jgi:tRNA dimethylallyltransferase
MLYFHALSAGMAPLPGADAAIRADIDSLGTREGWGAVHRELARVDPAAAARIHVNDPQRLQRALEVYRLTGQTITTLQRRRVPAFAGVEVKEFVLTPLERAELHTQIQLRFMAMLEAGLLAEVRGLFERGDLSAEHPSMRAVGYRQLWRHLAAVTPLNEAIEQAIAATRQLAKRQLTWLRRRTTAEWLDSMHPEVASVIIDALSRGGLAQRPRI